MCNYLLQEFVHWRSVLPVDVDLRIEVRLEFELLLLEFLDVNLARRLLKFSNL